MSKRDQYRVRVTALVSGWATYDIPEGDKIRHFVDGSSEVEWDLSTVRDFEYHEAEYEQTYDSNDCWGDCDVEDASNLETRAPYPLVDAETEEVAPDNDDGFPF
jgi:hypothetical protein